jgi:peptidoglycan/LPS O-acetylase OafA/YrhL
VKRIPSLDGLRAISIALVVLGHWGANHYGWQFALSYANLGVRIFFIISGYLITTLLLKERTKTGTIHLKDFYIRRAYRILPAATVFIVPITILRWHELSWYHIAAAVLYLPDLDRPRFIGHLWSLSVEEQFYLLWPSVLKKWYEHRSRILLGVVAIAPFYRLICYAMHVIGADFTFPAVADNLAIGCLLAIFAPQIKRISAGLALAMTAAVVLIPLYPSTSKGRTLILLFALWPVLHISIAGVLLHVVQTPYRVLNWGPVMWLGKISYSLYLWQQVFAFDKGPEPPIFLAYAVGTACASYYLIEQPMLKLRERRAAKSNRMEMPAPAENARTAAKIA